MRAASLALDLHKANLPNVLAFVLLVGAGVAIALLPLTLAGAAVVGGLAFLLVLVRLEYGIYLAILSVPFGSIREFSVGPASVAASEFIVPLLFASWVMSLLARREFKIRLTPIFPFAVLFFGALAVTATVAPDVSLSAKELMKWGEFLLLYVVAANVLSTRRQIAIVVAFLVLATSLEALHGWYQFLLRKGPEGFLIGGRFLRAFGTFGQPNPYAGYLGLTLPILLGLLIGAKWDLSLRIDWGFFLLVASTLFTMAAMLMSFSRGALLGLAVAVGFMIWTRSRRFFALLLGGLLAAIAIALLGALNLLPPQLAERFSSVTRHVGIFDVRQVTLTPENWAIVERMAYWQSAWEMFRDHPILGVGIGNFRVFYADYAMPGWLLGVQGHAHNYYLNVLAEAGVVGLAAYLAFLLAIFVFALRALKGLKAGAATAAYDGVGAGTLATGETFSRRWDSLGGPMLYQGRTDTSFRGRSRVLPVEGWCGDPSSPPDPSLRLGATIRHHSFEAEQEFCDNRSVSPKGLAWFSQPYPLALGITGALLQFSVHNFFDTLYVHSMSLQVGLILGLLAATYPAQLKEGA